MSEITIRDFCCIDYAKIVEARFTVLIGKQASGKSIIAKLLYFFKRTMRDLYGFAEEELGKRELDRLIGDRFIEIFPSSAWRKKDFELRYVSGNAEIIIRSRSINKGTNKRIAIEYSDPLLKGYRYIRSLFKKEREGDDEGDEYSVRHISPRRRNYYLDQFSNKIGTGSIENTLFIPAGRSFFANLQNSVFSFLSSNNAVDPILTEFGSYYENIKRYRRVPPEESNNAKTYSDISKKLNNILGGDYFRDKGKEYIKAFDGRIVSLSSSSSGQQELLPLMIILKDLVFSLKTTRNRILFIEEPEAHLFPTAQKEIVELMAILYNRSLGKNSFFVTTHSPYVLTAFNNLVQAGFWYGSDSYNKTGKDAKGISLDMAITPGDFQAYTVEDGLLKSLVSDESGLIDVSMIDEASNDMALDFDELLDLLEND